MNKEKLFQSKGWQVINRIGTLNEMYYILVENYRELMHEILRIQKASQPFIELFDNKKLNRYIFNFFASTSALTDSCRKAMNFYKNTDLKIKYEIKKELFFKKNQTAFFIKDFRNYLTHFSIEFPLLSKSGEIAFSTQDLLQYKKWRSLSKEFIRQNDCEIVLKPLCEEYFRTLETFYMWLYAELKEYHKEDLKERNQMAKKLGIRISDI